MVGEAGRQGEQERSKAAAARDAGQPRQGAETVGGIFGGTWDNGWRTSWQSGWLVGGAKVGETVGELVGELVAGEVADSIGETVGEQVGGLVGERVGEEDGPIAPLLTLGFTFRRHRCRPATPLRPPRALRVFAISLAGSEDAVTGAQRWGTACCPGYCRMRPWSPLSPGVARRR